MNRIHLYAALGCAVLAFGCRTPEGRIMGDEEEGYVGNRAAGSSTYDRLIEGAVAKILDRTAAAHAGTGDLRVAFLGVENKSREALGDFHDQIYQFIDTSINTSERFRTISSRFVEAALRETRIKSDQLFIPQHRRAFAQTLEASGHPVEALLFATLTSGTTRGEGVRQVDYALTMELVDIQTGDNQKESVRLRKAYTR